MSSSARAPPGNSVEQGTDKGGRAEAVVGACDQQRGRGDPRQVRLDLRGDDAIDRGETLRVVAQPARAKSAVPLPCLPGAHLRRISRRSSPRSRLVGRVPAMAAARVSVAARRSGAISVAGAIATKAETRSGTRDAKRSTMPDPTAHPASATRVLISRHPVTPQDHPPWYRTLPVRGFSPIYPLHAHRSARHASY